MSSPLDGLSAVKLAWLAGQMRSRRDVMVHEPIAVVGMSCRFSGGADTPARYWDLLTRGVNTVRPVPADRWDSDAWFDPTPGTPGKIYVREGSFLDGVDQFDPGFFGISPREARGMDPQQRILLEEVVRAMESAGLEPRGLRGSATGVYVGVMHVDYNAVGITSRNDMQVVSMNYASVAAGRVSYILGLQGPSLAVDTACSSSLVATHLAVQALRDGECDLAVAAGVSLALSPLTMALLCGNRMLSPDGVCRTFDAGAAGFGRGEGCGVVLLRRLSDAMARGERIRAVIRGTAVNQDGRSAGLLVPNGVAQAKVIRAALANGALNPADISYVEAHGTGTAMGDPIELEALGGIFARDPKRTAPLRVGSVKTNIGHTEAAAGVASLIKVILSLEHEAIPPHLHLHTPNPHVRWDAVELQIPTRTQSWKRGDEPRRAGVSAFGYAGTNAHVVVE